MQDYITIFYERFEDILLAFLQHVVITSISVILACIVAIPLAIYLVKTNLRWLRSIVFSVSNIFQTIPSLALLAIFIPLLGVGLKPAITALFLYSLLPILRNTYTAFNLIDDHIVEAAIAMGYTSWQRLAKIELPLALPYMMSGIRLTTIYIINWATLAALIGAGGLGQLIIGGMGVNNRPLIFAAALIAMFFALVVDVIFTKMEKRLHRVAEQDKPYVLEERI